MVEVAGQRLAVAGAKGFGGGFAGRCGSDFGEPQMKAFIHHTKEVAARLGDALHSVGGNGRVALDIEGVPDGEHVPWIDPTHPAWRTAQCQRLH